MGRMGLHCDGGAALCGLHVVYNLHRFHAFRIIGGGRPFHVIGFVDFIDFHAFSLSCGGGPSVRSMSLVFMDFIDFHAVSHSWVGVTTGTRWAGNPGLHIAGVGYPGLVWLGFAYNWLCWD